MTLLERNVRELDKLGFQEIYLFTSPGLEPLKHFCHALPEALKISQVTVPENPREHWAALRAKEDGAILLLEGHALNDRRLISALLAARHDLAVLSPTGKNPAAAACISAVSAAAIPDRGTAALTEIIRAAVSAQHLPALNLSNFDPYMHNLRREVPPYLLKVEDETQYREAEAILKQTVQKGVLELVAKYIHPPLEFGAVRLIAETRITPNQITFIWLILAAVAIPLFLQGYLLPGFILAALCGVLDGVDGKLARLTLRYSTIGDWLDHASGTIYDALWYLALGWYFSGGDPHSTGAYYAYLLIGSYLVHRIVPGIFRLVHHREIYDYEKIDEFVRLICARMNHNVWLMLIGVSLGYARETFYLMSVWMAATGTWYILRFLWVSLLPKPLTGAWQLPKIS